MIPVPAPSDQHRDADEFGVEISFSPHSDTPSRVFRAVTNLIDAFQEIDGYLAKSISGKITPVMLLEDVEAGSIRVWLRNILEAVDDEALKTGEWKKVVGSFLVKAKRLIVKWTEGRTTVESIEDIESLRQELLNEAAKTDVLPIPLYTAVPTIEIARSVELIIGAIKPLRGADSVRYLSPAELPAEISRTFDIAPETMTDLMVEKSITSSDAEMYLIIKRPDFLGDSKWEFRHGRQAIEAKVSDADWLLRFRTGAESIQPGDALHASVSTTVRYGYDGEVVDTKHEVVTVMGIKKAPRPVQVAISLMSSEDQKLTTTDPENPQPSGT